MKTKLTDTAVTINTFVRRLVAYAVGDDNGAALVDSSLLDEEGDVTWLRSSRDDALAQYGLEAAVRSYAQAEAAVKTITDKAAGLLTLLVGALVLALAGTGLALHTNHNQQWLQGVSVGCFCVLDFLILIAAVNAFFATGVSRSGAVNLHRLQRHGLRGTGNLVRQEALAWHKGALQAMEDGGRRARDLFAARRWLLAALAVAIVAVGLLGADQVPPPNADGPTASSKIASMLAAAEFFSPETTWQLDPVSELLQGSSSRKSFGSVRGRLSGTDLMLRAAWVGPPACGRS